MLLGTAHYRRALGRCFPLISVNQRLTVSIWTGLVIRNDSFRMTMQGFLEIKDRLGWSFLSGHSPTVGPSGGACLKFRSLRMGLLQDPSTMSVLTTGVPRS